MSLQREIHIWCALIGFDREAADLGVGAFLARCGEVRPTALSLFLFHPDIIMVERGCIGRNTCLHTFIQARGIQ